ncbi:MAG: hypothetical protein JWR35_318 [Marmoricola sp.]|jgi:hypothetical protein|nr:hypothetical protein [Marmoricola sp.]
MRVLGIITVTVIGVVVVIGLVVAVMSVSDFKRYLRIRQM